MLLQQYYGNVIPTLAGVVEPILVQCCISLPHLHENSYSEPSSYPLPPSLPQIVKKNNRKQR